MIIDEQLFKSIDQVNGVYDLMVKVKPLPEDFLVELQAQVNAKNENTAEFLEWCKPYLIKATGDYTLGDYRVYDPYVTLYKNSNTFDGIEAQISDMRDEFYQANKKQYISSVWVEKLPKGEIWHEENFESLTPNKNHRVYDFTTGDNVLFATNKEAQAFIDGQILKVKNLMPEPLIQQLITYNGDDLSGWLPV